MQTSLEDLSGAGDRSLILIHGRDFKPAAEAYLDLSMAAIRSGIERDYPDCVGLLDDSLRDVAWYGDLAADVLGKCGKSYDEELDISDRRNALAALREITPRKRFGIRQYDSLPGKSAVPEFVANFLAPAVGRVGLSGPMISAIAKDVACYFDHKSQYADKVRGRLLEKLRDQLDRGQRIALLTHGSGSVVAYDVLWQLSHDPDLQPQYNEKKIELWLTMGSPLGDRNIQKRLMGAQEKGSARFPANVVSWHNVSAEDDYTCYDNTLADDFKPMLQERLVSAVNDYKIYNLAVRYGKSNPHSSIGYFVHPRVTKILCDWLQEKPVTTTPRYTL